LIDLATGRTTLGEMSLVTTKEAAQILGVTPVRVRQLIKEMRWAAEKHGRDHLLQDREVERQVRSPKSRV
jgi:excisionase family DNA binding protein